MTTTKTPTTHLASTAAKLPALIGKLQAERQDINGQMTKLKRAGLLYATTHWRAGKYLYLLYPTKVGEPRRREYVGTDPDRIKASEDAIQRAVEYEALKKQLARLDKLARECHVRVSEVTAMLAAW